MKDLLPHMVFMLIKPILCGFTKSLFNDLRQINTNIVSLIIVCCCWYCLQYCLLCFYDSLEGTLGPLQTREAVIDNFLVVDNKLPMTKHLVCELSYRLQNKGVDNVTK